MYRPHFAYATPPGCRDVPYEYVFDGSVQPLIPVAALSTSFGILFQLDKDAEFHWRGVKVGLQGVSVPLEVAWKDPKGRLLSDVVSNMNGAKPTVGTVLYAQGSGFAPSFGGMAVPWDEEIICPPGAVIESIWSAPSLAAENVPTLVSLLGVKRYYLEES